MKIVIVSDPHIGDYSYGKTDSETGLNTRLLDFLGNLDQSVDFAIKNEAEIYIIVGDIYRVKHPNSKIRKQFVPRIKKLLKNNIRVILLTGNHDMTTSSDGAHALSEMEELCELIEELEVYSRPQIISLDNTELYLLPFVNRSIEKLLTEEEFIEFQKNKIQEFNELTKKSKADHKLFFGHFGTDQSVIGASFDLDMSANENENMIKLSLFDEGQWTKVYLGHIHKQQEFNDVSRHVGSLGRVDFAEEKEQKGFYFFENGLDKFIEVKDREFKTFRLNLTEDDCKKKLASFADKIKKLDLTEVIVRVKVDVLQTYLPLLKFDDIESYLRENSWHSLGFDLNIINAEENKPEKEITTSDSPDDALKKHIEMHPERFQGIEDKAFKTGVEILKLVMQENVK